MVAKVWADKVTAKLRLGLFLMRSQMRPLDWVALNVRFTTNDKCAKLHTVAASNNRNDTPQSLYYCLFVPHIYGCYSSRTSRSFPAQTPPELRSQEEPGSGLIASAPVSGVSAPAYTNGVWPPVRPVSVAQKNNRRPCCPPMYHPSTYPWTAWPDGAERWDNWMAAQHLPRDLVRPSSGFNNSFKRKKIPFVVNRTFNETPTERLQEQWVSWVNILKMKILHWFVCFFKWGGANVTLFYKEAPASKNVGNQCIYRTKTEVLLPEPSTNKNKWYP